MSRRRLHMVYTSSSSDEDEPQPPNCNLRQSPQPPSPPPEDEVFADVEDDEIEEVGEVEAPYHEPIPNLEFVTLNSSTAAPSVDSVVISDEDFVDVPDDFSPPTEQPLPTTEAAGVFIASDCPVNDCLRRMGLFMRREWLDSCKLGLQNTVSGFTGFDVETKAKLCCAQALFSDLNYSGAGVLPPNVHEMHLVDLAGPFVLQVDEVVNISFPLKERYKSATPGLKRCLKLSMTDGVQRVFGMEYRPLPSKTLEELAPAGFKVVIRNINVRRGLLMLVPEVVEVLGGSVEELEAARGRLVHELNKPPRGKRSRTGVVPPLSVRATLAAWPQNIGHGNSVPVNGGYDIPGNNINSRFNASAPIHGNIQRVDTTSVNMQAHPDITEVSTRGQTERSTSGESAQCSMAREAAQDYTTMETDELPASREAAQHSTTIEMDDLPTSREATVVSSRRESTGYSVLSTNVIENEDAHMIAHVEHLSILSGGNELPFTYLASLSAKWVAVQEHQPFVQGKIKCFMTGVKKFQYQHRATFDLGVHVEDGSLISEIAIHHDVVQKAIGYSPEEVTAALAASDKYMRNVLKQFQFFLINFEGTMLVEMNKTSPVPVALEMSQGSSTLDARLLLRRLKPITSSEQRHNSKSDSGVINLSP